MKLPKQQVAGWQPAAVELETARFGDQLRVKIDNHQNHPAFAPLRLCVRQFIVK
jgi:hypothetical protein